MKLSFIIISLIISIAGFSQGLYKSDKGKIKFFSDAPIEDIEATSGKATAALNSSTGEVAVLIPIKSFEFDKALMQEHFNENYMESAKYPNASFRGNVSEKFTLKPGENIQVMASGSLTIHGVSLPREIGFMLKTNADGSVVGTGKFKVKLEDHKIKIPTLVFQNIAEEVEVTFEISLKQSVQ